MWSTPSRGQLPNQNEVVVAISPEGKELEMYRIGNLWFPVGSATYVYWTPVMWKAL